MKFLVDEDLPRSITSLLKKYQYDVEDVRDVGLRGFPDSEIALYAIKHQRCLITADQGFCDILHYPPTRYFGIVVLVLPRNATAPDIVKLTESFLKHPEVVDQLTGKLAIVEFGRVRVRDGHL